MAKSYPRVERQKMHPERRKGRCCCCDEPATTYVCIRSSYMRGDDDDVICCDAHTVLAIEDLPEFMNQWRVRVQHLRVPVVAQHEETGRLWEGLRRDLPPRYREVTQ